MLPDLSLDVWRRVAQQRPSVARRLARVVRHLGLRELAVRHIQRAWRSGYSFSDNLENAVLRLPIWEPATFGAGDDRCSVQSTPSRRSLLYRDPLLRRAQQVDAFSIGVYSVGVMGGVLNHEDCLFDVRRLRERNIAQYEPEALEIEDAPFDLALDLLTAMDDDFCIRRMCCVLHSERCLTEEAVRPGGGKRSRFGAVACVAANTEDPHDPVVGSHRGDEWISSTKVDMQIELEQRPFIGQANASPLVIHSAQVYDANLVRLGVAGSYDGISVRFMPEF
eukprot:5323535-Prymnesium_polylepis.1